jgi:hypothetical protein
MARENQGLQIALIIFVMLTIILGVTTYLFFRQYEDADNRARTHLVDHERAAKLAAANEKDVDELKRLLFGVATKEKVDAITSTTFNEDMKKYGGSYPPAARFYRPLLEKMSKTIDEKSAALALAEAKIKKLEDNFSVREANKQPQIDTLQKAAVDASKDLAAERTKFQNDRNRITQEQATLKTDLDNARKQKDASLAKMEATLQAAGAVNQKLQDINKTLSNRQEQLTAQKFDVPNGAVRWVNQRTGTVWIDLGRADALQRLVSFSVYPADVVDMTASGKKGSIEVTQVPGDHLAEARVLDDNLVDPILPGDKIYTPVWTPGQPRRFALAGFMDIDGDGRSDLQTVLKLITMNGGVVDCYLDDKGKQVGHMTINTSNLVKGQAPTEKGQTEMIKEYSKMIGESQRLGIQEVKLIDLLQRMGWKNPSPIVHFGRDANPKDFAPKPEGGVQSKSTGNVSDVFKPRQPPQGPSKSYYRFGM